MAGGEVRNDAFSHDRSDGVSHSHKKPDASNLRESQSFFFSSPVPPQTNIKKTHPTAVSPHALQQYTHTHTHTHTANLRESPPSPVLNTQTHRHTQTRLQPHSVLTLSSPMYLHTQHKHNTHTHTHTYQTYVTWQVLAGLRAGTRLSDAVARCCRTLAPSPASCAAASFRIPFRRLLTLTPIDSN